MHHCQLSWCLGNRVIFLSWICKVYVDLSLILGTCIKKYRSTSYLGKEQVQTPRNLLHVPKQSGPNLLLNLLLLVALTFIKIEKTKHESFDFIHLLSFFLVMHNSKLYCVCKHMHTKQLLCYWR